MSSLTWPTIEAPPIRLHRAQAEFLTSSARFKGFVGGRGVGKTWIGAQDLIARAREGRTYLIASPTAVMMNDTTLPTFRKQAEEMGVWGSMRVSPYPTVELTTGATVRFRTAEDPEKMRGPNLTGVWLDEASLMHKEAFNISIAALREGGEQGWLSATFTPKGLGHWTYEVFGKGRPDVEVFHAPTKANPFLPPDFHHRLAVQYGERGLRSQQELDGRFVNVEGAEWPPEYFEGVWCDGFPPDLAATAMALDPSKGKEAHKPKEGRDPDYSAYVWGGVDREGVVWVDADLDNTRDTSRMVADGLGHFRRFRPQAVLVETNQFQSLLGGEFIRAAKAANIGTLPLWGVDNYENKETRIRQVGPVLAQRQLRFRRSPGAELLVQQLRDFPAGEYDDGPDALQMLLVMLVWLKTGAAGGAQPKLLRA